MMPLSTPKWRKSVKISTLKENGYINFEPKSQSKGKDFEIRIKVIKDTQNNESTEELFVISDGDVLYPKGVSYPSN